MSSLIDGGISPPGNNAGKRPDFQPVYTSKSEMTSGGWRSERDSKSWYCRAAVVIEPVSANSLHETGVFPKTAGDYPPFCFEGCETRSLEIEPNAEKVGISGHMRGKLKT